MSDGASWYHDVHDLIPFRVREVLLVASPYDAFTLEEDAGIADQLLERYSELRLTASPRITFVASGAHALAMIEQRSFDLVITMSRIGDVEAWSLGRRIKAMEPELAVVLLGFREAEFMRMREDADIFDGVFVWTGDAAIVLAIIKLVEDAKNVAHDTEAGAVSVILVVEDSVRRYSSFLMLFYEELLKQSASLVEEGLNRRHKVMRMRGRPKILLATSYEDAVECIDRYADHLLALVSDVRYSRDGEEDSEAGYRLVEYVRERISELPVLLQSAERSVQTRAEALETSWADKNSTELPRRVSQFFRESLGFGPFVFRLPDRTIVGQAANVYEMEQALLTVPEASIEFHAAHHHFSRWLRARNMLQLARRVRPVSIESSGGVDAFRRDLRKMLRDAYAEESAALITDYSEREAWFDSPFLRLGSGSIGGKARGVAFLNALIKRRGLSERFDGLRIRTPRTIAIGTDVFDRFMESNALYPVVAEATQSQIVERFLQGQFDAELLTDLRSVLSELRGPIAVRSSSLLEDAQFQPFAGIYETCLLPNAHPNPAVRFEHFLAAIKRVYASTFSTNARAYLEGTPYAVEEEKMGVVIQEVVGQRYGPRFYPTISGVGLSYNYYPVSDQRAEEGLVMLALGLGRAVVSGGRVLQFSPKSPGQLPQFPSPRDALALSQKKFFAIDMEQTEFQPDPEGTLVELPIEDAEADGTLALAASVYDGANDILRDSLRDKGPRVITFSNLLKWNAFPLAEALDEILTATRDGMGSPVEIEFAVDVPEGWSPELNLLQVRPQVTHANTGGVDTIPEDGLWIRSAQALGNGVVRELRDVVYVRPGATVDRNTSQIIADRVGALNRELSERGYVLVGPGRWGTSDTSLGVAVAWGQISNAKVIVETPFDDRSVEPSQGSHFFHNIASLGIGYITVARLDDTALYDVDWLEAQPAVYEDEYLRHVALEGSCTAYLDGRHSRAAVTKHDA
ncbi:MAG: PEP/pyruvate-binding domain-containing protein [Deltaproteobacteria bacterium]